MHVAYIHQHFSTKKRATGTRSYEMSRRLIGADRNNPNHPDQRRKLAGAGRAPAGRVFSRDMLCDPFVNVLEQAHTEFHAQENELVSA